MDKILGWLKNGNKNGSQTEANAGQAEHEPVAGSSSASIGSSMEPDARAAMIIRVLREILLQPEKLNDVVDMIPFLLPESQQAKMVTNLIFSNLKFTSYGGDFFFIQRMIGYDEVPQYEVERLQTQVSDIIKSILLPRVNEAFFEKLVERINQQFEADYFRLKSPYILNDEYIRERAPALIKELLPNLLQEALPYLRIERQKKNWRLNRQLTKEDIGKKIALPTSNRKTISVQVAFDNDQFFLEIVKGSTTKKIPSIQLPLFDMAYPTRIVQTEQPRRLPTDDDSQIRGTLSEQIADKLQLNRVLIESVHTHAARKLTIVPDDNITDIINCLADWFPQEPRIIELKNSIHIINKWSPLEKQNFVYDVSTLTNEIIFPQLLTSDSLTQYIPDPDSYTGLWHKPFIEQQADVLVRVLLNQLPSAKSEESVGTEFIRALKLDDILVKVVQGQIIERITDQFQSPTIDIVLDILRRLPPDDTQHIALINLIEAEKASLTLIETLLSNTQQMLLHSLLPKLTSQFLADEVGKIPIKGKYSLQNLSHFVEQRALEVTLALLQTLPQATLPPLYIERDDNGWRVNRNIIHADIDSMLPLPLLENKTAFARINFNLRSQKFYLTLSGVPDKSDFGHANINIKPPFSDDRYAIYLKPDVTKKPVTKIDDRVILNNGTEAKVISIGTGDNPLVQLQIAQKRNEVDAGALQRNVPIFLNGIKNYGRVIYQFSDSSLSFWRPQPPTVLEPLTPQKIISQLQVATIFNDFHAELKAKVIAKMQSDLALASNMINELLTPVQKTMLPEFILSGRATLEEKIRLTRLVNQMIRDNILPRLDNDFLNKVVTEYLYDETYHDNASFLEVQAEKIIEKIVGAVLDRPLIALKIERQGEHWAINRHCAPEDIGQMIAIPALDGRTKFARIDFDTERQQFSLHLSGVDKQTYEQVALGHLLLEINTPFSDFKYPIVVQQTRQEETIQQAGEAITLKTGNYESASLITAQVLSIGTEDNPLVQLAMPVLSEAEKKALQRNIIVLRDGSEIYGRVIYQFADGSALNYWQPQEKQQDLIPSLSKKDHLQGGVDILLKTAYARLVKSRICEKISSLSITPATALKKLTTFLPLDLEAASLQSLANSQQISPELLSSLVRNIDRLIKETFLPRLTESVLDLMVTPSGLDLVDYQFLDHYIEQQTNKIIQQSLLKNISPTVLPIEISKVGERWKSNRHFTQEDVGNRVAIVIETEKVLFAKVGFDARFHRFFLEISGAVPGEFSQNNFKIYPPFSENVYGMKVNAGYRSYAVSQLGDQVDFRFAGKVALTATVASMGTAEDPFVRLALPQDVSLVQRSLLPENIGVLKPEGMIYQRIIYQLPDGSNFPNWAPTLHQTLLGSVGKYIINQLAPLGRQLALQSQNLSPPVRSGFALQGLSTKHSVPRDDVDSWVRPVVKIAPSQYDEPDRVAKTRVIIQLENDLHSLHAVEGLAGKHPEETLIFQRDQSGKLNLVYGEEAAQRGKLSLFFVAHGRGGEKNVYNNSTLGGYSANELAVVTQEIYGKLQYQQGISQPIDKLILVGCALATLENPRDFVSDFVTETLKQKVKPREISAYTTTIGITSVHNERGVGHRHQVSEGTVGEMANQFKLSFRFNPAKQAYLPTLRTRLQQLTAITNALRHPDALPIQFLQPQQHEVLRQAFQRPDGTLDVERAILTLHDPERYQAWHDNLQQLQQYSVIHPVLLETDSLQTRGWHDNLQQLQQHSVIHPVLLETDSLQTRARPDNLQQLQQQSAIHPVLLETDSLQTRARPDNLQQLQQHSVIRPVLLETDSLQTRARPDNLQQLQQHSVIRPVLLETDSLQTRAWPDNLQQLQRQSETHLALETDSIQTALRKTRQAVFDEKQRDWQRQGQGQSAPNSWYSLGSNRTLERINVHSNRLATGMQALSYIMGIYRITKYQRQLRNVNLTTKERTELEFERNLSLASLSYNGIAEPVQLGLGKAYPLLARQVLARSAGLLPPFKSSAARLGFKMKFAGARFGGAGLSFGGAVFDIVDLKSSLTVLSSETDPEIRQDLQVSIALSSISLAVNVITSLAFLGSATLAATLGPIGVVISAGILIGGSLYSAYREMESLNRHIELTTAEKWDTGARAFVGLPPAADLQMRLAIEQQKPEFRKEYNRALFNEAYQNRLLATPGIDTYVYSNGDFDLVAHPYQELWIRTKMPRQLRRAVITQPAYVDREGNVTYLPADRRVAEYVRPEQLEKIKNDKSYQELLKEGEELYLKQANTAPGYYYTPGMFKHIDDNFDARYNEKNEIEKHHSAHGLADKNAREGRLDPDDHIYRDIYHRNLESYHHDRKVLRDAGKPDNNPNSLGVRQIRKTRLFNPQRAASIDLGDGNDNGIGFEQKRNIFIGGQGKKHYTGGQLEDIFYLGRTQAPISTVPDASLASFFDGAGSDQDMLIIDASYEGVSGYLVDLQQGEVYYREEEKPDRLAAKIANIEHVRGHLTGDDRLVGDDGVNYLNGRGGHDTLYGNGGNDTLTLAAGYAFGGTGEDSYIILQNNSAATISIDDSSDRQQPEKTEYSSILLDYDAKDILSMRIHKKPPPHRYLQSHQLEILLRNQNGSQTMLILRDAYHRSAEDQPLKLINRYSLVTRDGFQLSPDDWPLTIEQQNGQWSLPPLPVHYISSFDRSGAIRVGRQNAIELNQATNKIKINGIERQLPSVFKLLLTDTGFNDKIIGNGSDNFLYSNGGHDWLQGGEGSDTYHIAHVPAKNRVISIDNDDPEQKLDFIKFTSITLDQLNQPTREGEDLLLIAMIPAPELGMLILRIKNFFTDERYRHIALVDQEGDRFGLDVDTKNNHQMVFYRLIFDEKEQQFYRCEQQIIPFATTGDDKVILLGVSPLFNHHFDAGAGNDQVLIQRHGDFSVYGGTGDDIVTVEPYKKGEKTLYGNDGNDQLYGGDHNDKLYGGSDDDILKGNLGDDILEGGIGNDSYLYRWGDGYDQITDSGGEDTLKVFEMSEEEIQLRGTASRLILNFTNAKGGILFSEQVEQIDVNGALFDTARLVEAMSHFGTQAETSPINLTSLISVVGRKNLLSTGVVG